MKTDPSGADKQSASPSLKLSDIVVRLIISCVAAYAGHELAKHRLAPHIENNTKAHERTIKKLEEMDGRLRRLERELVNPASSQPGFDSRTDRRVLIALVSLRSNAEGIDNGSERETSGVGI